MPYLLIFLIMWQKAEKIKQWNSSRPEPGGFCLRCFMKLFYCPFCCCSFLALHLSLHLIFRHQPTSTLLNQLLHHGDGRSVTFLHACWCCMYYITIWHPTMSEYTFTQQPPVWNQSQPDCENLLDFLSESLWTFTVMAGLNLSLFLSGLLLHFTLFTACYPISSSSQAFELVTDTFPVSLLQNLSDSLQISIFTGIM